MYTRYQIGSREEWLSRKYHVPFGGDFKLSGTDAPIVCGHSPWTSPAELYDYKLGIQKRKDISDNPNVLYGIQSEPLIRAQFAIDLPYFKIEYHEFDILESTLYPWMTCTLDGELTVIRENPWGLPIGAKGILEVKTGSFRSGSDLAKWNDGIGIPVYYYEQMVHCMIVTDYSFVMNPVRLHRDAWKDTDQGFPEIRTFYRIVDRRSKSVQTDMEDLVAIERNFIDLLKRKERPAVKLSMEI